MHDLRQDCHGNQSFRQTEYHFFEYSFLGGGGGGGGILFNKLSSSHILCPVSSYRFLSLILKG